MNNNTSDKYTRLDFKRVTNRRIFSPTTDIRVKTEPFDKNTSMQFSNNDYNMNNNMHLNQHSTKNNYQYNMPNNNRSIFSASTIESDVYDNANNNINNSVNLNIKEDCMSCSNNKEQLVQAYKLACLNYKSSNLNINGKIVSRKDALDKMADILNIINQSMNLKY